MKIRALTPSEIEGFRTRNWDLFLYANLEAGKYFQDEVLQGYVLVLEKTDGTLTYTWTDTNPSANDPSKWGYITQEFLEALKKNTINTFKFLGYTISYTALVVVIVIAVLYWPLIQSTLKQIKRR